MINNIENLLQTDVLNDLYQKSKDEDFIGKDTQNLINKCKLLIYFYPLNRKLLKEEEISDFYIISQNSIRNTIYNFHYSNISFKIYFINYIKITVNYYKLKTNHDYIFNNLILEAVVKHSDTFEKETIYDEREKDPITIAKYKYKMVSEEQQEYLNLIKDYNFNNTKDFKSLFNEVIKIPNNKDKNINFSEMDKYKEKMNRKSTRKNILLFLLTMPDAILECYVNEVAYLFSTNQTTIISLFSCSRDLLETKYKRYQKYSQLNNKHYKNYLLNHYKLTSNFYDEDLIQTSINWNRKAMNNNAQKIRKTLNMHVSQRTLARELDINKGTVASSISAAKKLLNKAVFIS